MAQIVKITTAESIEDFVKRIKKIHRFKRIGRGAYSEIYHSNNTSPRKVLKVGVITFAPSVDGWLQYAIAAMKNPTNPWLPKIKDLRICKNSRNLDCDDWGYYTATMERLHEVKFRIGNDVAEEIENAISFLSGLDEDDDNYLGSLLPIFNTIPLKLKVKMDGDKNLIAAINLIYKLIKNRPEREFEMDLHDENIMQRSNGHLVIIDPIQ